MKKNMQIEKGTIILDLCIEDDRFEFVSSIENAMSIAENELLEIEEKITESAENIKKLTPECDKVDYILAASSGMICGIIDIFLVGKPGESLVGDVTDKWFGERTKDFAKLCGWNDKDGGTLSSAIKHIEKKFKIPYDQTGMGGNSGLIFDLNPKNHHFKSLAHNPTLLGLFFAILDQFNNTSHFVSVGELISLEEADGKFELRGNDIPSKLFCAFTNWFGHLISDMSGASGSRTRGMGIPSPLWSWTNDIVALKRKFNIPVLEFDKSVNELALQIYKKGYDARFQSAQTIPVFVNEIVVRLLYSIRRLIRYFVDVKEEEYSFQLLWKVCEPFSNVTIKRMLAVAHGTFCLADTGDAVISGFATGGGSFNVVEFFIRLNIVGIGRFGISLYGEVNRGINKKTTKEEIYFLTRKKNIISDYIVGLRFLAELYDDGLLLTFVEDLKQSNMYKQAFEKTVLLAEKRNVQEEIILRSKADIDAYFGGKND